VIELGMRGIPAPKALVFDLKRDYDCLAASYPDVWRFKLPGPEFRWNPLEPPIGDWQNWAGIFAAVVSNSCGFYSGASTENLLYKTLLELYRRYNVERGVYPCLLDLRDYLYWMRISKRVDRYSEEYNSFVRVLNRAENLCSAFGETLECSSGYPISEVLAHHTVFDMAELKPDAQAFFTESFINEMVWHRMELGERGGVIRNLVCFDEGKRHMPKYRENAQQSISNISHNMAMGREFGIGFVVADCEPSLLANSIKSSAYTRACFHQTHGDDITDSARSLGLDQEQAAEIHRLRRGEAIIRLAGRIKRPFLLKVVK